MELVLSALISAIAVVVIAQHAWAGKAHFDSQKMPPGAILISLVVLTSGALFLYLTWTLPLSVPAVAVGFSLMVFSWWLFWRTIRASRNARLKLAFDETSPHGLVTEGPYRYVRHPFYVSYLLFWIGWSTAIWHPIVLMPLAVIAIIYVAAARMEERKFAATSMSDDYEAYRARVGFLWPRFPGSAA